MVHDMVELEKAGIPTVIILSHGFEHDAQVSARAFGMPSIRFTVVPRVYNNITLEEARAQTEPVIDEVVRLLTTPVDGHQA